MPSRRWQSGQSALNREVLAYVFERFPKFSQTFCYREIAELFQQGVRPAIFSLRRPDFGPETTWDDSITSTVHQLPEGDVLRDWQTRRQPVCQKRCEKLYTN